MQTFWYIIIIMCSIGLFMGVFNFIKLLFTPNDKFPHTTEIKEITLRQVSISFSWICIGIVAVFETLLLCGIVHIAKAQGFSLLLSSLFVWRSIAWWLHTQSIYKSIDHIHQGFLYRSQKKEIAFALNSVFLCAYTIVVLLAYNVV